MNLTFSVQALAAHYIANNYAKLEPGLRQFPEELNHDIARTKLDTLGITLTS